MLRVRVANAFLASYAEVRGGTAQIIGAFPEWWTIPRIPTSFVIYAVVQLDVEIDDEPESDETEGPFSIVLSLHRPDGSADPPVGRFQTNNRGPNSATDANRRDFDPLHGIFTFPVPVTFAADGKYQVEIEVTGCQSVFVPFGLHVGPPPEGSTGITMGSASPT